MRIRATLATLLAAAFITVGGAGVAVADEADVAPPLLSTNVVCVTTDFPVLGSGWKVQAAVAMWNEAQDVVTFTVEAACADVVVHRYLSTTDGRCGYTAWDRVWSSNVGGRVSGADVYLNDACVGAGAAFTKRTVAHELGHAMGLPHLESTRSIMSTTIAWPVQPEVGEVDVRNLAVLYR